MPLLRRYADCDPVPITCCCQPLPGHSHSIINKPGETCGGADFPVSVSVETMKNTMFSCVANRHQPKPAPRQTPYLLIFTLDPNIDYI